MLGLKQLYLFTYVLAAFVASACSGQDPESHQIRSGAQPVKLSLEDRPSIVVLGDSLTSGFGLNLEEAFPAVLQEYLDGSEYSYEMVNAGVSGDTSAGGVRRLDWVLDRNVEVMIVALGGNDGLRGLPVEAMKDNLTTIVETAMQRDIVVILAGMEAPPNLGQIYTVEFREAFSEVAGEYNVPFVPFLLEGVAGVNELNQSDGIHPNLEGARRVAEHLWPVLESVLEDISTP